jgi:hypothetical protein
MSFEYKLGKERDVPGQPIPLGKGKLKPRGRSRERLVEPWSQADSAFENMFAATIMRRWGHLF